MPSVAASERAALADLFLEVGPDAPTLCGHWLTRDLAAHLVLRERRIDAMPGIAVPRLAGHTEAVQQRLAARPWPELVDKVRHRSPFLVGPLDDTFNTTEFYVHHEDVRRAVSGWSPRPSDERTERTMWRVLRTRGRAFFRHSPVGVLLSLPDGTTHVVVGGQPSITLTGPATELLLYAHGRKDHALVKITGDEEDVERFSSTPLAV
jgi:uncharacterized protein (TIGR03085 family)